MANTNVICSEKEIKQALVDKINNFKDISRVTNEGRETGFTYQVVSMSTIANDKDVTLSAFYYDVDSQKKALIEIINNNTILDVFKKLNKICAKKYNGQNKFHTEVIEQIKDAISEYKDGFTVKFDFPGDE